MDGRAVLNMAVALLLAGHVSAQPIGLDESRRQMNAAAVRADRTAYAGFLCDDVTSVDRAGWLRDKIATVADLPAGGAQPQGDVHLYFDGAVVVIDFVNGAVHASIIQAWVKGDDRWQMVAFQGVGVGSTSVTPAPKQSATLPRNLGRQAEREAVLASIDHMTAALGQGDVNAWANHVVDDYVETAPGGELTTKAERLRQVGATGPQLGFGSTVQGDVSVRIHGSLAVVNMRVRFSAASREHWRTFIAIERGGTWRVAATITTPITGVA